MAIYEVDVTQLEFDVKSWTKLSKTLQNAMIIKVVTFVFNIDG